jgi:hypothetical protein
MPDAITASTNSDAKRSFMMMMSDDDRVAAVARKMSDQPKFVQIWSVNK